MSEESERRFHAIMDKLFQPPPVSKSKSTTTTSSTSVSGAQLSRGNKGAITGSALSVLQSKSRGNVAEKLQTSSLSGGSVAAPSCRPWDRGDFFRRLATFKSMTWFAKPEVVSAVNCARRGWVNVDMDIIACEVCEARLLFSTPSSWTLEQVEKAAAVFSLKLDNGHKLHCPWIDNACDEMLAQFPPAPAGVLVDNYKKRYSAILQLLALPVISLSAIDFKQSPHLERFLKEHLDIECGNKSSHTFQTECLGDECEAASSASYYQALKLISLCGWERRLLPYTVDSKNWEHQSTEQANLSDLSHEVPSRENHRITVYTSGPSERVEATDNLMDSNRVQYDPNSVVLDCRLCGASVGLWVFSTVERPLEFARLVGYSEVNGGDDGSIQHQENVICLDSAPPGALDSSIENHVKRKECTSSSNEILKLTIAGGPPPAKQNFRAIISLPVIGRNLRAWFSSDSDFQDWLSDKVSSQGNSDRALDCVTGLSSQPGEEELVEGKTTDNGNCKDMRTDPLQSVNMDISEQQNKLGNENNNLAYLDNDICEQQDSLGNRNNFHIVVEGKNIIRQAFSETEGPDSSMENLVGSPLNLVESSPKNDRMPENVEMLKPAAGIHETHQVNDNSVTVQDAPITIGNEETSENGISGTTKAVSSPATDPICCTQVGNDDCGQHKGNVQPLCEDGVPICMSRDAKKTPLEKEMKFDPIRQHRHFCPWIAPTGNTAPGWQQTLSALQRQEEFSHPSTKQAPSSSLIEVDDPVGSVRRLFTPPSAKRVKLTHGSS